MFSAKFVFEIGRKSAQFKYTIKHNIRIFLGSDQIARPNRKVCSLTIPSINILNILNNVFANNLLLIDYQWWTE